MFQDGSISIFAILLSFLVILLVTPLSDGRGIVVVNLNATTQQNPHAEAHPLDINKIFSWLIASSPFLINETRTDAAHFGTTTTTIGFRLDKRNVFDWVSQKFSTLSGAILIAAIFLNILVVTFCYYQGCDVFQHIGRLFSGTP